MKKFLWKIIVLLLLVTPVLHFTTVYLLESYLEEEYAVDIENSFIGDPARLFSGEVRLREVVAANIDDYLRARLLIRLGVRVDVTVTAGVDTIIYPATATVSTQEVLRPPLPHEIAADNFRLMSKGLSVSVEIILAWDSLLVSLISIVYLLAAAVVIMRFYRTGAARARAEMIEKSKEIDRLRELEGQHADRLSSLDNEKRRLSSEMVTVRNNLLKYKETASRNEDAMIDEIIALEEKIVQNIRLREALQEENESLRQLARRTEDEKRRSVTKGSAYGNIEKRFKILYKNISINRRALDNFIDLTDDMRLKAEEIIKQMDGNSSEIGVKRKLELKKSREKVFEIIFSYNGRLYFRNGFDGKPEVLAIGTKNSQTRDMAFLDSL